MAKLDMKAFRSHACTDTHSLQLLIQASSKLGYHKAHGKVYSWIDSSGEFLKAAAFSAVDLVHHLALSLLGLIGIASQSGRNFLYENLMRSLIDLSAIIIGVGGAIYPWFGLAATGKVIDILNRTVLGKAALKEVEYKGLSLAAPIYFMKYQYAHSQQTHVGLREHWGGKDSDLVKRAR